MTGFGRIGDDVGGWGGCPGSQFQVLKSRICDSDGGPVWDNIHLQNISCKVEGGFVLDYFTGRFSDQLFLYSCYFVVG